MVATIRRSDPNMLIHVSLPEREPSFSFAKSYDSMLDQSVKVQGTSPKKKTKKQKKKKQTAARASPKALTC